MKLQSSISDLRGAAQLACDATVGVTDVVEQMHGTIMRLPLPLGPLRKTPDAGLARLVYGSIRGTTRLVDHIIGAAARPLMGESPNETGSAQRDAIVAALNGLAGDHLARSGNPLATTMQLRRGGPVIHPEDAQPRRWLILAHGLCMNDLQWQREGHDHGQALAHDLGLMPVYLRYNSGLGVRENGELLAQELELFLQRKCEQDDEISILGYSLGGLVARSAVATAQESKLNWPDQLRKLIFLGTPHAGAPLAVSGHGIDLALKLSPYSAAIARLVGARSQGLHDLRHGLATDAQTEGYGLPPGVSTLSIAGALSGQPGLVGDSLLGDGLVPTRSALGVRMPSDKGSCQRVVRGAGHLDLLNSARVYRYLADWLA